MQFLRILRSSIVILLAGAPLLIIIRDYAFAEPRISVSADSLFSVPSEMVTRSVSPFSASPADDVCSISGRSLTGADSNLPSIRGPLVLHGWSNPWAINAFAKDLYWFRPGNVSLVDGELIFSVSEGASGQAQAHDDQKSRSARFEVDVTTDRGIPGLIQSPLYLYGDQADEVDFEILGDKGLQLAIHTKDRFNAYRLLIPGDFSGRHRYSIEYKAGASVIWFVDGHQVGCATPAETGGVFPRNPLKPFIETWPTGNVSWAGLWTHTPSTMIVHGYRRAIL
nr:family 16 glycosylhydrolase [uncultured Brevundimonas sp.]